MSVAVLLLLFALLLFLSIGISTGRSPASRSDYFVAGRRGTALIIGGSVFATVVGGSATIGVAGLVYEQGLTGAWWTLVGAGGLVVLALVFARRIRAHAVYTLPGLVEQLYGRGVSVLVAVVIVVAWTGVVSGQIVAAARVSGFLGVGEVSGWMVAFTAVLVGYAVIGGQRAILRTDALQGLLILLGLVVAAVALLLDGGMRAALSTALPADALDFPVSESFGWMELCRMAILVGSVYVVGPDIYTRVLSARDAATAQRAVIYAAAFVVPAAAFVALIGLAASVRAPGIPAEEALPWMMANGLPAGVAGVLFVALVGALMSSADSTLLGQGVVFADDVIGRIWSLGEERTVLVSRISVAALGVLSLVLALSLRGVIESLLFAYSVFTSGVVGPVIVGLLADERWRPGSRSTFMGVCIGGAFGLAGALPALSVPMKSSLPLMGFALSIAVPLTDVAVRAARRRLRP